MPARPFDEYRKAYPYLISDMMSYFEMSNAVIDDRGFHSRTLMQFIEHFASIHDGARLQPRPISQICSQLCNQGWMSEVSTGGIMGMDSTYLTIKRGGEIDFHSPESQRMFNCAVFGMPSVYEYYSNSVIPIVNWDAQGDQQIGTGFIIAPVAMVTALHCLQPASAISIRGVSAEALKRAKFFSHKNRALDVALILFESPVFGDLPNIPVSRADADILTEVMALGYPNIPGFHPTLAAEAAQISARLSASRGRVASLPTEIFANAELLLVTARVRGGFSGGPVLDSFGQAVGVVSREPAAEFSEGLGARYDQLGYGTVIPSKSIVQILDEVSSMTASSINMDEAEFRDFDD